MKHTRTVNPIKTPLESMAISAGAGTGKTYALTSKLLLLLLGGVHINEILAITFTNKAAGEIKDRLLTRLEKISYKEDKSIVEFRKILKIDEDTLIKRTKELHNDIIKYFSSLKISTIDSFFASILKQFPYDIGISLDTTIIDESERKIVFNEALEKFYRKLNSNEKLFKRVFDYIRSRNNQSFKTKNHFENLFNNFNTNYFKLMDSQIYRPSLINKAEKNFNEISFYIKSKEFEKIINETLHTLNIYLSSDNIYNKKNIKSFYDKLNKFLPLKNIYTLQNISVFQASDPAEINYIQKISERKPELWRTIIDNLRKIRETIANYVKAKINYQFYQEVEIFSLIRELFSQLKMNKNLLDFEDIEEQTYQFLKYLNEFNYFKYRMDTSIKYILIDEFQDTSELQWNAIEPIVNEAIKMNGNLIYVGDIKQSIYQWRGGNPNLFKRIKQKYNLKDEKLKINYRSKPLILDFINKIFKDISSKYPDFEYDPLTLSPELQNQSKNSGFVYVKAYKENDNIGKAVVNQIKQLYINGVNYFDIAVLCEKNSQITEIENLLKSNGIPSTGSGKRLLLDDYAVVDILNILRFLSDPFEEIYIVSILRSPLFRVKYETLNRIRNDYGELSLKSLKKYRPEIFNTLEKLLIESRYLSISKLILKLIKEFSIFDIYPDNRDSILDLYELSFNFENTSSKTSILDFIEYLEEAGNEIKSTTASITGVQLSTIHSAKGLEYHTVIVPYLNTDKNYTKDNQYYFKESNEKTITGFIKSSTEYEKFSSDSDFQKMIDKIKRDYLIEKINLIYVAFTRAKNNLIIIPTFDKRKIGGLFLESLYPIIDFKEEPPDEYKSGKIIPSEEKAKKSTIWKDSFDIDRSKLFAVSKTHKTSQLEDKVQVEGNLFTHRVSILKGLIVHRVLSYIKEIPIQTELLDKFFNRAISYEGKNFTKFEKDEAIIPSKITLKNILNDKKIAKFFSKNSYAEITTLGNEYQNLIGRIDRLLIDKDSIEIIDFKTDQIRKIDDIKEFIKDYKKQIDSYCKTVKDMFPKKVIKGYIYFTEAPVEYRLQNIWLKD